MKFDRDSSLPVARKFVLGLWLGGALVAVTAASVPAWAQERRGDSAASDDAPGGDIVVTARRRAESILDAPVAVSVTSGDDLRALNITRETDLIQVTPGLTAQIGSTGSRSHATYAIRGQAGGSGLTEYLADVPEMSSAFFDLENVQVLKGPQGTLFGRVTTGGAILFTPKRPGDVLNGYLNTRIGGFERRDFEGAIGGPIVPGLLSARISGQLDYSGGFSRNRLNGKYLDGRNSKYFRAVVDLTPAEGLRNETIGVLEYVKDPIRAVINGVVIPNGSSVLGGALLTGSRQRIAPSVAAAIGLSCPGGVCPSYYDATLSAFNDQLGRSHYDVADDADNYPHDNSRHWGLINTTTYDATARLSLKNIFSYSVTDTAGPTIENFDGSSLPLLTRLTAANKGPRAVTEEFQVQLKPSDALEFTGGFYYEKRWTPNYQLSNVVSNAGYLGSCTLAVACTASFAPSRTGFGVQFQTVNGITYAYAGAISDLSKTENQDMAVYGQFTWNVTDKLSLSAGGRYTWSDRLLYSARVSSADLLNGTYALPSATLMVGHLSFLVPTGAAAFPTGLSVNRLDANYEKFTYTIAATYEMTRDLTFYATTRRGYKPGSFNSRAPFTYGPETVNDYEVGVKYGGRLGAFRTLVSFDAYYDDYTNIQRSTTLQDPASGQPYLSVQNIAAATIKGIDLDVTLSYGGWLNLAGFFNITDAHYDKYPNTGQLASSGIPATADLTTMRLQFTSEYQAGFRPSIDIGKLAGSDQNILVSGNLYYQSSFASGEPNIGTYPSRSIMPGSTKLDLRLDWREILKTRLSASFAVTNVTDYRGRLATNALATSTGFSYDAYAEPRSWYVELHYDF